MTVNKAEDGTAYTQEDINALIDHYLSNTPRWSIEVRLHPLVRGVLYAITYVSAPRLTPPTKQEIWM